MQELEEHNAAAAFTFAMSAATEEAIIEALHACDQFKINRGAAPVA